MPDPGARRKPKRLDAAALFQYALKLLGGRAHSQAEIRAKLAAKAEQQQDVEPAMERLRQYGYLNDARFAESFAGARLANDRLGKTRVLRDLRSRRVAPALAEKAVRDAYSGVDEIALIEEFAERRILRYGSGERLNDPKELASAYRKLVRAGFKTADILTVLHRMAREPAMLEGFEPPREESAEEP